jgi:hypothetical protein
MNHLILVCLLATLVGCTSQMKVPVVEAQPQLQTAPTRVLSDLNDQRPRPNPQPFEGAVVSIDLIRGQANLDCIRCRETIRAGRALVRLTRLGPSGELEPYGDGFAVLVSNDFQPNQLGYGCITRYTSYDGRPHQILSHILDEQTGRFEPDIIPVSWALVTIK